MKKSLDVNRIKSDKEALLYVLDAVFDAPHECEGILLELFGSLRQAGALAMREAAAQEAERWGDVGKSAGAIIRSIDPATLKGE